VLRIIATGWTCFRAAAGVNIMEFCKQFNARTQDKTGKICPVQITVYKTNHLNLLFHTAVQLMEAAKLKSVLVSLIVKSS
jgi:ribosomal protein L11